jgi:hypothetical protein
MLLWRLERRLVQLRRKMRRKPHKLNAPLSPTPRHPGDFDPSQTSTSIPANALDEIFHRFLLLLFVSSSSFSIPLFSSSSFLPSPHLSPLSPLPPLSLNSSRSVLIIPFSPQLHYLFPSPSYLGPLLHPTKSVSAKTALPASPPWVMILPTERVREPPFLP